MKRGEHRKRLQISEKSTFEVNLIETVASISSEFTAMVSASRNWKQTTNQIARVGNTSEVLRRIGDATLSRKVDPRGPLLVFHKREMTTSAIAILQL